MNFADKLLNAIDEKQNPCIVGLDTEFSKIPEFIKEYNKDKFGTTFEAVSNSILDFNKKIIDSVYDIVPAIKIQIAFYEQYGSLGIKAFEDTVKYAKSKKLIVIEDAKRNDIGNTTTAYSKAHLGQVEVFNNKEFNFHVDCITVNPYLGFDGIKPFIEDVKEHNKGIFVLVKTSNTSSIDIQDLESKNKKIYEIVAELVNKWSQDTKGNRGYSSVGAVVGATYPNEAEKLRKIMPNSIFLVPGYGAQGGTAKDIVNCFNDDGYGAIINSSRGIIFAYNKDNENDFDESARDAAIKMKDDVCSALKFSNKYPW